MKTINERVDWTLMMSIVQTALFSIALGALILLTNVRLAATRPEVYEYSFSQHDAVETTGVPREDLDRAAREIIAYFGSGHQPYLTIEVSINGEPTPLFKERELLHMRDVRELFQSTFFVQEIALALVVLYVAGVVITYRRAAIDRLARQVLVAGAAITVVLTLAAGAMLVGFHWLFTQFHLISFANDWWMLNPRTDRLVQMFPDGFWFDVAMGVGLLTLAEAILIALLGYVVLRHRTRQSQDSNLPAHVSE